jgi:superfamily II DNA or RNA helicase
MLEGNPANFAEQLSLTEVILPVLQSSAHNCVHCNYRVDLDNGKTRFVDFAIISPTTRIAIEIDGYKYHAEGAVSRQSFDDGLDRQNELILQGWVVIRFSFDQIRGTPEKCKDQLRRAIITDGLLHRNFSHIGVEPTQLQIEVLAALAQSRADGSRRGLVALPTGTGKTILSALDSKRMGGKILFVVHNNEILRQAEAAYKRVRPDCTTGFINSEYLKASYDEDMVFANIASLRNPSIYQRFAKDYFDYVVLDEFHHGAANSYQNVVRYFQPKFMLGLTATPDRTDKKDILKLLGKNFVFALSTADAIGRGFLVPFSYYGLHDDIDYTQIHHNGFRYDTSDLEKALLIPMRDKAIFEKYIEYGETKKTIGFCISIRHAERMAEYFNSRGVKAVAVHSNLNLDERRRRIAGYATGAFQCVFVRDIFNEGVDFPETEALMFLRPTESKIVFTQQLGRGLRLHPKKQNVLVLDFIGNYLGAGIVASAVYQLGGGAGNKIRDPKPQYVFENGCKVTFSAKAIESLSIPSHVVFDKTKYIAAIARRFEVVRRPLSPLDVLVATGSDFGPLLLSMKGYGRVIDRMNSLEHGVQLLDSKYAELDPLSSGDDEINPSFIDDLVSQVIVEVSNLLDVVRKFRLRISRKSNLAFSEFTEIQNHLVINTSTLCFLRNYLDSSDSRKVPADKSFIGTQNWASSFFDYIRDHSTNRNAFALSNYLRENFGFFCFIGSLEQRNLGSASLVHIGRRLLEMKNIVWLADFFDLINEESFQSPFGDDGNLVLDLPGPKLEPKGLLSINRKAHPSVSDQSRHVKQLNASTTSQDPEATCPKGKRRIDIIELLALLSKRFPLSTPQLFAELAFRGMTLNGAKKMADLQNHLEKSGLVTYDAADKVWRLVGVETAIQRTPH